MNDSKLEGIAIDALAQVSGGLPTPGAHGMWSKMPKAFSDKLPPNGMQQTPWDVSGWKYWSKGSQNWLRDQLHLAPGWRGGRGPTGAPDLSQ